MVPGGSQARVSQRAAPVRVERGGEGAVPRPAEAEGGRGGGGGGAVEEAGAELGAHQVVEDGVDGGVEVDHDAAEVEDVVVVLDAEPLHRLVRDDDDPEDEDAEGYEAEEEAEDDGAEHEDDLASGAHAVRVDVFVKDDFGGVADEVLGDDGVYDEEEDQGDEEEEEDGHEEVEGRPEGVGEGVARWY